MPATAPRVRLVVSGKVIALLLLSLSLLGGGYYWYSLQQQARQQLWQTQERFKTPPYFVNRGASVIRGCGHCVDLGKLKPQPEWKVGLPKEIPVEERRWFLAMEDPPLPVTVAGVLMLPVHPAFQDDPSFGFDQTRVMLVLYQSLEKKSWIEQPLPAQSPPPPIFVPDPPKPSPLDSPRPHTTEAATVVKLKSPFVGDWRNIDPNTKSLTRLVIAGDRELVVHAWANCPPVLCDWGTTTPVPLPPVDRGFGIVWDHKYALHRQYLSLDAGRLKVILQTHFIDNSGRKDIEIVSVFSRVTETP